MVFAVRFAGPALLVLFALLVWRASPNQQLNRRFTTFTLVVALWSTSVTAAHGGADTHFWVPMSFAAGSLIPVSFLAFMQAYRPAAAPQARRLFRIWTALAVLFSVLSLTTDLVVSDPSLTDQGLRKTEGPLYPAFALFIIAGWAMAVGVFVSKWQVARGRSRAELQYLAAGMIVPGMGVLVTNLLMPWITGKSIYGSMGPYFALCFVAIIGHALIRRRITDLRLVVHQSLTFAAATLISAVPAAALTIAFWPRFFNQLQPNELFLTLGLITLIVILIAPTRDAARIILDRYVYRTHTNYQRTVREASRMLTDVLDLRELLSFIKTTIVGSVGVEGVAIYLKHDGVFHLARAPGKVDPKFEETTIAPSEVILALERSREALLVDDLGHHFIDGNDRKLFNVVTRMNWSLVLPLVYENSIIGFIAAGPKLSGDPFYGQDLDLLSTLANQAGVAVKNAQLYADVVLANEYIERIVATIESAVVAINAGRRIAMFNRAAQQLTGSSASDLLDQPVSVLPSTLAEPLLASLADGAPRAIPEIELVTNRGTYPVICTTSALRGRDGRVLGAVAVFSDLTSLKQLEIERRRAERLAYFEALASGIAHEIKNPLVAIKTFVQLVPRRQTDPRFMEEFGRIVGREIQRMERLVERLRTLARDERRPASGIDVRAPLLDAVECLQATFDEKGVMLDVMTTPSIGSVLGDHEGLEQIFLNLLMNAHEATPPGGSVSIQIVEDHEHITVSVADSGPGIPQELLDRIFEPFFSTKERGSGLGLAIAAGIARAHGATLRAGNRSVGGAVFIVDFPLSSVQAPVDK